MRAGETFQSTQACPQARHAHIGHSEDRGAASPHSSVVLTAAWQEVEMGDLWGRATLGKGGPQEARGS